MSGRGQRVWSLPSCAKTALPHPKLQRRGGEQTGIDLRDVVSKLDVIGILPGVSAHVKRPAAEKLLVVREPAELEIKAVGNHVWGATDVVRIINHREIGGVDAAEILESAQS